MEDRRIPWLLALGAIPAGLIIYCAVSFVSATANYYNLSNRDTSGPLYFWLIIILVGLTIWGIRKCTYRFAPTDVVVVCKGMDIAYYGHVRSIVLPPFGGFAPAHFDPGSKPIGFALRLPTREGAYVLAEASGEWHPDTEDIGAYFANPNPEKLIVSRGLAAFQAWSRTRTAEEIYANPNIPPIEVPGAVVTLDLVNIEHDATRTFPVPVDRQKAITELVADVRSVASLEIARAALLASMPDQADFINTYCDQRKATIMTGAVK
jgi:hypothetical protein